jgi:hypothetical protein
VDLRLDQFDLSEATHISADEVSEVKPLEECVAMGDAFFACLDGSKQLLDDDDRSLLQSIFHPALTDRREEGDLFVPPSARHAYVHKLRALVKEEESVRAKRTEAFASKDFTMNRPGTLFPYSWTSSVQFMEDETQGALKSCTEYTGKEAALLERVAKNSVFDKTTEDGSTFRIYKSGGLEVRTTQELDGSEVVAAVFSA